MLLIVARHGNTFTGEEIPYQVGRHQDIPLVADGMRQALKLADHLKTANLSPQAIYSAPLKRTEEFARIIGHACNNLNVLIDERLTELDYGKWAGLSESEIITRYGSSEYDAWQKHGTWPTSAGWQVCESEVVKQISKFTSELVKTHNNEKVLLVTSNGIIRYFLDLIPGLRQEYANKAKLKVTTGAYSLFELKSTQWHLLEWNKKP